MPLIKSGSKAALHQNIAEMVRAGHPQTQAVAAAYRNAREHGGRFAFGGSIPGYAPGGNVSPPWFVRNEARSMGHVGFIGSLVPGRTDRHHMSVAGGSYVLPADVVSSVGQGNSLAGANSLSRQFKMGPYGSAPSQIHGVAPPHFAKAIRQKFADGGDAGESAPADIVTAGGEFIVDPETVKRIGGGDLTHGHNILDAMVKHVRSRTVKKLKSLPGPKKRS